MPRRWRAISNFYLHRLIFLREPADPEAAECAAAARSFLTWIKAARPST